MYDLPLQSQALYMRRLSKSVQNKSTSIQIYGFTLRQTFVFVIYGVKVLSQGLALKARPKGRVLMCDLSGSDQRLFKSHSFILANMNLIA